MIDSDIFVIDNFYPEDANFESNKRSLSVVKELPETTTIINLLEICGIISHNLSKGKLLSFYQRFPEKYCLQVLHPLSIGLHISDFWERLILRTFDKIQEKMGFADALILNIAEEHPISHFITWNARHFEGKTFLPVLTPQEYLADTKNKEYTSGPWIIGNSKSPLP